MPRGAAPRVMQPEKPEPHLSLVDNIGIGDTVIEKAQEEQQTRLQVIEGVLHLDPVPGTRRTYRPRQAPVQAVVETIRVNAVAKGIALLIAGGNWQRCRMIDANTVVVYNHPIRRKKTNAGRTRNTR